MPAVMTSTLRLRGNDAEHRGLNYGRSPLS